MTQHTPREQELARLVAGANSIACPQRMLFVCLTGANPKDACRLIYEPFDDAGGKIPVTFKDRAQALYRIAGSELNKFASQRLCLAIEDFLGGVMTSPELVAFKASSPMKFPMVHYKNILEEIAAEDPGVAEWLSQQ